MLVEELPPDQAAPLWASCTSDWLMSERKKL
jgi:hypothetical protein